MPRQDSALAAGCAATAALACLIGLAGGCGREGEIRPGDIRTYTVPRVVAGPIQPAPTAAAARGTAGPLRYDVPEGWSDRGASGMRLTTLAIGDPALGHEVSVIPASGTLRGNVERWYGQLEPEADAGSKQQAVDAALAEATSVTAGPLQATVVLLAQASAAAPQAILGAMLPRGDSGALFVKFKGDAEVARRERDNFIRFVSSIRMDVDDPARP